MFQTDIHRYLQQWDHPWLVKFMEAITYLGYPLFFMVFILILILGFNFKKGFILLQVLIWTGMLTYLCKNAFALPRPYLVDDRVLLLDGELPGNHRQRFSASDATDFWSGLPENVVNYYRTNPDIEYGFPSGHASIAIAFWWTLFFLFRKRYLLGIALFLSFLIPLSRIYLGVHFIAAILGGITIGLICLAIFHFLFVRREKLNSFLESTHWDMTVKIRQVLPLLFYFVFPIVLFFFMKPEEIGLPAYLLGFNLGFWWIAYKGFPKVGRTLGKSILAFVIGATVFFLLSKGLKTLYIVTELQDVMALNIFRYFISTFTCMVLGYTLFIRYGIWERQEAIS